ncbi:MAG: hypothetical protein EKK47_19200 [Burkholderiales bacterium]|nr:MAG: hypothetical protein EKK47_19200 [Burkholderiales bacterium]
MNLKRILVKLLAIGAVAFPVLFVVKTYLIQAPQSTYPSHPAIYSQSISPDVSTPKDAQTEKLIAYINEYEQLLQNAQADASPGCIHVLNLGLPRFKALQKLPGKSEAIHEDELIKNAAEEQEMQNVIAKNPKSYCMPSQPQSGKNSCEEFWHNRYKKMREIITHQILLDKINYADAARMELLTLKGSLNIYCKQILNKNDRRP